MSRDVGKWDAMNCNRHHCSGNEIINLRDSAPGTPFRHGNRSPDTTPSESTRFRKFGLYIARPVCLWEARYVPAPCCSAPNRFSPGHDLEPAMRLLESLKASNACEKIGSSNQHSYYGCPPFFLSSNFSKKEHQNES